MARDGKPKGALATQRKREAHSGWPKAIFNRHAHATPSSIAGSRFSNDRAWRLKTAATSSRVQLKAPTGSGKSTSVPGMLMDAGISGMILVIEPRRMAARLLAGWVAKQRGATLGRQIGNEARLDSKYRGDTRGSPVHERH